MKITKAFYLGEPVEVLEDFTDGLGEGWVPALWADGKICIHWRDQLKSSPWES